MNSKSTTDSMHELSSDELLKTLLHYSALIAEEKKLDSLLVLMNDLGKEILVCDRCTLWLYDESSDELWTKVAHGIEQIHMPSTKGLVGQCAKIQKPVIVNDPYSHPQFNADVDKDTGYKTESLLMVPLFRADGELLGAYQACNKKNKATGFTETDTLRLQMTATFSSKSLESALLYREVEETQKELVYILGEAGESRSKETGNHVKRVGEFSFVLAKAYGLDLEECEVIRLSAPLHDLGKVSIPDAILNKPARLTFEEFEIMKTHAKAGYDILKKSPRKILQTAATMAYEHQEKFDGSGYPRGLKGEEIHLYGRICAIADVFDALSHDRCYKKAWPFKDVIKLFEDERGKHFDPILIDLMFDNIEEFKQIMVKFSDQFEP